MCNIIANVLISYCFFHVTFNLLSAVRSPPSSYTKSHGKIILHWYCANATCAYRALVFQNRFVWYVYINCLFNISWVQVLNFLITSNAISYYFDGCFLFWHPRWVFNNLPGTPLLPHSKIIFDNCAKNFTVSLNFLNSNNNYFVRTRRTRDDHKPT